MKLSLGCIADDYTGASDLANTLTRQGLRTVQTIGVPSDDLALPEVDAVVVSLKSRSIEADVAVSRSRAAEKWLRGRGAGHVLFKICSTFDSTDAGNIGPVMDALRADCGDAIVLVTPAFPETGRTVYQGNLFVGAVPLNESPLKDHPLNPMHDSNLVRVLARQSRTKVGLVDLATLSRGADAVRARLADLAGKGIGAAVIDAVFDRDLETIGGVALDHRLSVGASGIGLGLARALVASGKVKSAAAGAASGAPVGGPAACLAGSCSQATLAQVANAEKDMAVLHLDPEQVIAGDSEVRRALAWAQRSNQCRSCPDRFELDAGPSRSSAIPSWPRCSGTCHRAGHGRYRGGPGAIRCTAAGGCRWRNFRRRGRPPAHSRIPRRRRNRCRSAGFALRRGRPGRDAACSEIGQFRRTGVLLRRPRADALIAARFLFGMPNHAP